MRFKSRINRIEKELMTLDGKEITIIIDDIGAGVPKLDELRAEYKEELSKFYHSKLGKGEYVVFVTAEEIYEYIQSLS